MEERKGSCRRVGTRIKCTPPPPLLGDSRWNNLSAGHKPVNIRREDPVARSLLRSDSLNHMWNVENINQNCAQTLPCIKNWSWLSPLESVVGCLRSRQCGLLLHGVGKKLLKPTEWIRRRRIKHSQTHACTCMCANPNLKSLQSFIQSCAWQRPATHPWLSTTFSRTPFTHVIV